jgi:hypothetical protein
MNMYDPAADDLGRPPTTLAQAEGRRLFLSTRVAQWQAQCSRLSRGSGRAKIIAALNADVEALRETNNWLKELRRQSTKQGTYRFDSKSTLKHPALASLSLVATSKPAYIPEAESRLFADTEQDTPEGYMPMRNADFLRYVARRVERDEDGPIPRPLVRL